MSKETGTVQEVLDMIVEAHNSVAEEVNRGLLSAQSGIDAIGDRIAALEHRVTGLDRGHVALSNRVGALYDALDTRLDMQNKALAGVIERLVALERGGGTGGKPRSMDDFFDIGSKVEITSGSVFELCERDGLVFLQHERFGCRLTCSQAFRPKGATRREIIDALDENGWVLMDSTINGEPLLLDDPGTGDACEKPAAHAEPVHDIAWAVARLRDGLRVRRPGWPDWWFVNHELSTEWFTFNNSDLLATDWEVVS